MQQLSVVIIVHNEESSIERCLDSLRDVADEILVVDANSTDRTREICAARGCRVIQEQWRGFAEQKNLANSLAKNDWILSIDADEILSTELAQSIQTAKSHFRGYFYKVNRRNFYGNVWIKHGGWYPDMRIRLFDRRKASWSGFVHESLTIQGASEPPLLMGDLLHYSYNSVEDHVSRINAYTTLAALQMKQRGENSRVVRAAFQGLGECLMRFVVRLGFLDGYRGLIIAVLAGYEHFLTAVKLYYLYFEESELVAVQNN